MKLLVCNAGSTSLKFKLFEMPEERVLAQCGIERVGSVDDAVLHYCSMVDGYTVEKEGLSIPSYASGIELFLSCMTEPGHRVLSSFDEIERVGFKTVLSKGHYGVHEITEDVKQGMRDFIPVAPAHNAPYLTAIEQFSQVMPKAKMIGCFETAFHQTIPVERVTYGIPYEWQKRLGIRRMGYHGASHEYVSTVLTELYGSTGKAISCHLGGSDSLCAINEGKSVDTSFGMSLQAGLNQSNRCGDVDPFVILYLLQSGLSLDEVRTGLTKDGGLKGLSGVSGDMRYVEQAAEEGDERAVLALRVFYNDIVRYIGAFYAELGGLDHLVFTAGIGEHDARLRRAVCSKIAHLGIMLDDERNESVSGEAAVISSDDSPVSVLVIPTNEELIVARKTFAA